MSGNEIPPSQSKNAHSIEGRISQSQVIAPKPSNAFQEAYSLCANAHLDARWRQAEVALDGLVVGGFKDIPNEFQKHPWETAGKATLAVGTGLVVGALLAAESPWIVGGTLLVSGIAIGAGSVMTWNELSHKKDLCIAMNDAWRSGDAKTMHASKVNAERSLGPVGFDLGLYSVVGATTGVVSRFAAKPLATAIGRLGFLSGWTSKGIASGLAQNEVIADGIKAIHAAPVAAASDMPVSPSGKLTLAEYDCKCKFDPHSNYGAFCAQDFVPLPVEKEIIDTALQEANTMIPDGVKLKGTLRLAAWGEGILHIDLASAAGREFTDQESTKLLGLGLRLTDKGYKLPDGKTIYVELTDQGFDPPSYDD